MLTFILSSFFAFLSLLALYLVYFLLLKPLIGIKPYRTQGIKMTFFPILGNVKTCLDSRSATGDFYGHWKKMVQQNPRLQAFGGNFFDRAQLYLVDPTLIKEFYKAQENYVKTPQINDLIKFVVGESASTAEGQTWKRHRKIISFAFRFEVLKEKVSEIVKLSDQLIEDFKKRDLNQVHLSREFQTIAGEAIGRLFFGENFGEHRIQGKPAIAFLNEILDRVGEEGFTWSYLFLGIKVIEWGCLPRYINIRRDTQEFRSLMAGIIEEKKEKAKKRGSVRLGDSSLTLLDVLLSEEITHSEQALSTEEIINEFITLVAGGSTTTGEAVTRCIYFLQKYPEYKNKLMEEVNMYFKDPSKLTIDDLNQMELMSAFIKEVLRVFPTIIGIFDRLAVKDHALGNIKVKKGTIVNVAALCNNFNPLYHDCEEEFKPERWLGNSKTKESCTKDPLLYIPFSAGPKNCIGQHLAIAEIKVMLGLFLKKFDFELDLDYKLRTTVRLGYGPLDAMYFKLIPK